MSSRGAVTRHVLLSTRCGTMLCALLTLYPTSAALDIRIGVVEEPPRMLLLEASVRAALRQLGERGDVVVTPVEPDEQLSPPAQVCSQAMNGATFVLCGGGGSSLGSAAAVRAGLPLLVPDEVTADVAREVLSLYPHPEMLARVCEELCAAKGWDRAVLLHEGAAVGGALLAPDPEPLALVVRQLPAADEPVLLRNLLLVLKKQHTNNFIVWCDAECGVRVLDAAQRVGLLSARHSYILLTLDLHTQNLADYSYGGANVTGLRLFDPAATIVRDMIGNWTASYADLPSSKPEEKQVAEASKSPPVVIQLAMQAAGLATEALRRLRLPAARPAFCSSGAAAFHADTLLNYLRSVRMALEVRSEDACANDVH